MLYTRPFAGLAATGLLALSTLAGAQPAGHGSHPPMPDQRFYFSCRLEGGKEPTVIEVPLRMPTPTAPADLDQLVRLPKPLGPIHLTQYLPRATLEQMAVPDDRDNAPPAIELSIDGAKQSFQRWLVAGDVERNRLVSFIGTWRYMSVADSKQRDELLTQFKTEFTREPKLVVSRLDGSQSREVPVKVGSATVLEGLGCKISVRSFFPDFAMDNTTHSPVNQSNRRNNPAALLEIEHEGSRQERWVVARFPEYNPSNAQALPFRISLKCPALPKGNTPDFALVTVNRTTHEVWTRNQGKITTSPLAIHQRVDIPGSQYTFQINAYVPRARLAEHYKAAEGGDATPALRIETTDASGSRKPLWLELGKQRLVPTPQGLMVVAFGPRKSRPTGGHP